MKKMPLIFAALMLAAAVGAQPQPDLIARIHFAGAEAISTDMNRFTFTNLFYSAEARALASQTLDKLSRAPGAWFKSKLPPGAGDGAAQLRPLLDDLLKSEWILEMRDTTRLAGIRAGDPVERRTRAALEQKSGGVVAKLDGHWNFPGQIRHLGTQKTSAAESAPVQPFRRLGGD